MGESGENTDEWVREFRCSLEAHTIGLAFWPYPKMSPPSSDRNYSAPRNSDETVSYQKRIQLSHQERESRDPTEKGCISLKLTH